MPFVASVPVPFVDFVVFVVSLICPGVSCSSMSTIRFIIAVIILAIIAGALLFGGIYGFKLFGFL